MHYKKSFDIRLIATAIVLLTSGCTSFPRDPNNTLRNAMGKTLRVGATENPPWIVRSGNDASGAEADLVNEFARELNATVDWHWEGESENLMALEQFQLDLVVGGLTNETPWKKYVGLTNPYFVSDIKVGVPSSIPVPESLKGLTVATKSGNYVGGYLKSKGAIPVNVQTISNSSSAVAAPDWELEQQGMTAMASKLYTEKHVMAVPPGENEFLRRLDDLLYRHRGEVKALLQQHEAKR